MTEALIAALTSAATAGVAIAVCRLVLSRAPSRLMRTNVSGTEVPAILGVPVIVPGVAGIVSVAILLSVISATTLEESLAVAWALVLMGAAGVWDDLRGDERPRGFAGHLGALKGRAVTGGIVKIVAAVLVGFFAAAFLPSRGAAPAAHVVEVVALVGLSANLINLFDRAPGRATKVALLIAVPLLAVGDTGWALASAPVLAAVAATLYFDLGERGMLGDAGANPLGAVLGVGLAASLGEPGRLVTIVIFLALNLASEKWSFSRAIEATPPLRWLDGLGRRDQGAPK